MDWCAGKSLRLFLGRSKMLSDECGLHGSHGLGLSELNKARPTNESWRLGFLGCLIWRSLISTSPILLLTFDTCLGIVAVTARRARSGEAWSSACEMRSGRDHSNSGRRCNPMTSRSPALVRSELWTITCVPPDSAARILPSKTAPCVRRHWSNPERERS